MKHKKLSKPYGFAGQHEKDLASMEREIVVLKQKLSRALLSLSSYNPALAEHIERNA